MLLHQKIWTEPQRMNPRLEEDRLSSKLLSIVTVFFFFNHFSRLRSNLNLLENVIV